MLRFFLHYPVAKRFRILSVLFTLLVVYMHRWHINLSFFRIYSPYMLNFIIYYGFLGKFPQAVTADAPCDSVQVSAAPFGLSHYTGVGIR